MNNKIFNPFTQEFVFINSKDGEYITYLEKICISCNDGKYYNQIKNKCVKIPDKKNTVLLEQIHLCEKFLKAKKDVPPLTKSDMYNILSKIVIAQNNILSLLKIDLTKFIKIPLVSELSVIITSLFTIYNFNSVSIFNKLFIEIYKVLGNNEIAVYFFKLIYTLITYISDIYKLPLVKIKLIVTYVYRLIYKYHYLPMFMFKQAIYILLGLFEVVKYDYIKSETIVNNLSVSETNIVKNISPNTETIKFDIFDIIPDFKYYEKGSLLYPIFENTNVNYISSFHDVSKFYNRITVKNNIDIVLTSNEYKFLVQNGIIYKEYNVANASINNSNISLLIPKHLNHQNTVFKAIYMKNNMIYLQYARYNNNNTEYQFNQPLQYYAYPEYQDTLKQLRLCRYTVPIQRFLNESISILNKHNETSTVFSLNMGYLDKIKKEIKKKLEKISDIKNKIGKQHSTNTKDVNANILAQSNIMKKNKLNLEIKSLLEDIKILNNQKEQYYKNIRRPTLFFKNNRRYQAKIFLSLPDGKPDKIQLEMINSVINHLKSVLDNTESVVTNKKLQTEIKLKEITEKLKQMSAVINGIKNTTGLEKITDIFYRNNLPGLFNKYGTIINCIEIFKPILNNIDPKSQLTFNINQRCIQPKHLDNTPSIQITNEKSVYHDITSVIKINDNKTDTITKRKSLDKKIENPTTVKSSSDRKIENHDFDVQKFLEDIKF